MNKIEKLIKYLDNKYPSNLTANTGSKYWHAERFNIRLSNHPSSGEDKLEMSIIIPSNSESYVVTMGSAFYVFTSTATVISFIEHLEWTIPIVSSLRLSPEYGKGVYTDRALANDTLKKELQVLRQQASQMQSLLQVAKTNGTLGKKHKPLLDGLLKVKITQ